MTKPVIAVVFDFDETLGPDTISFFLQKNGISPTKFWQEVEKMVKKGWDPPLAYMHKMLELSKSGKLNISKKALSEIGSELKLFPGLPDAFNELKNYVTKTPKLKKINISLEFYVISGGLEEMIRGTKVAPFINAVFGCNFAYDTKGNPIGIKSAVSFTEKTRYIYGLKKGVKIADLRGNPYKINDSIPTSMHRIPFPQMIYIGDGPTDIPCLSAVTDNGGTGIGASAPFGSFKKGYELARGKRITVGPYTANYKKGSDMRKVIEETILRVGLELDVDKKKRVISAPRN